MRRWWLLLCCLATPAWADFKDAYREGVKAAERQDWARVESQMREALADQPTPNARVRLYGMAYSAYVPHFYLGLAAFSKGDCRAALGYFDNAAHRTVIAGLADELARQKMMVDRCQARLAQSPPAASPPVTPAAPAATAPRPTAPAATTAPASAATTPASTAASAPAVPPATTSTTTPPRPDAARVANARRLAQQTGATVGAVGRDAQAAGNSAWIAQHRGLNTELTRLADAIATADTTRLASIERELTALGTRATALQKTIADAASAAKSKQLVDARARLAQSISAARTVAAITPDPGLTTALTRATAQQTSDDLVALVEATRALDAAAAAVKLQAQERAANAAARRALLPLVDAFLAGDFARAAAWRDDPALRELPRARAQLLLLRSAAAFELYVLGGESDAALIETVRQDLRQSRALDAKVAPSQRAFSPRFRALFASTR